MDSDWLGLDATVELVIIFGDITTDQAWNLFLSTIRVRREKMRTGTKKNHVGQGGDSWVDQNKRWLL